MRWGEGVGRKREQVSFLFPVLLLPFSNPFLPLPPCSFSIKGIYEDERTREGELVRGGL